MKRKIVWLVVSCLMALSLLLTSCAEAVTEEEEVIAPPEEEEEVAPPEEEEVVPVPEGPRYGGVLNLAEGAPIIQMDEAGGQSHETMPLNNFGFDCLTRVAWEKGPSGTGEAGMQRLSLVIPRLMKGALAESWEFPDEETIIVHLRKGVHFHNKPPVNGRELVADDVVHTMYRLYYEVPGAYNNISWTPDRKPQSVRAIDKYTVEFKVVPGMAGEVMRGAFDYTRITAHEVIDEYGDMEHWTRLIGTGPFVIVDHVVASSATFVRNPDYWEKDPFHPENTLPYVDGVKVFIIEDASTRMAALRTGKLDQLGVDWEERDTLSSYTPELQYAIYVEASSIVTNVWMRTDTPPFDDIRVRRALAIAVDQREMLKELYGGDGTLLSMPIGPFKDFEELFTPIDELPESAREQFDYNPDKAKQLLAEAGYPDGFKTSVLCCFPEQVDVLSVVAAYLADIGVELEIDVKEYGAFAGMAVGKRYTQMVSAWGISLNPLRFHNYRVGSLYNFSILDDPVVMKMYEECPQPITEAEWQDMVLRFKEVVPYIIDQCWSIQLPQPNYYIMWWPWLKGYNGEITVSFHYVSTWASYVWLDQDMKEEMTGRR